MRTNPLRVGVLASGFGSNLQALIDRQMNQPAYFSIELVIANNPDAYALTRAQQGSIPYDLIDHRAHKARAFFESAILKKLWAHQIELLVLAGFTKILSTDFLKQFSRPIINIHPSLLPKYPGLHGINQAFFAGDSVTGCTVHMVDQGVDTGTIIAQASCPILDGECLEDLKKRVHGLEHELLPSVVHTIAKMSHKNGFELDVFEQVYLAPKKNAANYNAYAHEQE